MLVSKNWGREMKRILLTITMLAVCTSQGWASNTCDLAADVAKKGYTAYQVDKAKGIKLFIRANQLCQSNPSFGYNVGLAYLRYGLPSKAVTYLEKAVEQKKNIAWLNNLGEAYLILNKPEDAVEVAKKSLAIKKNVHAESLRIRAYEDRGHLTKALMLSRDAVKAYTGHSELQTSFERIKKSYLEYYLTLLPKNKAKGLEGLLKATFFPVGAKAYCLALLQTGDTAKALQEASRLKKTFPGNKEIAEVEEKIFDTKIRSFYLTYSEGNKASALADAKRFVEVTVPGNSKAKKAYDDLFNAFIEETALVDIPKPPKTIQKKTPGREGKLDTLLAGLEQEPEVNQGSIELRVDVDVNIPKGARKNINAVGVIIGNKNYARARKGIGDVSFADRDAKIMQKYLITTLGYDRQNIIFKNDATLVDLIDTFGSGNGRGGQLRNYIRKGKSDVFIYYVGHGAPGPNGKSSYLVPVNASVDNISGNGYKLENLYKAVEKLPARSVTVVIDACFSGDSASGSLFKNISPAMLKSSSPVKNVSKANVFAGAGEGQVATWYKAKSHSTFTYFFLKGLGGEADQDSNKRITVSEMKDYLLDEVPYWAQRTTNRVQEPVVKGKGEFELVRLR